MVEAVKNEERVTWRYMKIFEREQMLREEGRIEGRVEGREEGRAEERVNTERERKRAEKAEEEVKRLRELLKVNKM